jgi:histidyl-tRNA synthetase
MQTAGIDAAHEAAALTTIDKLDKIGQGGVRDELAGRGISSEAANSLMLLVLTGDGEIERMFGGPSGPQAGLQRMRKQITDPRGIQALDELGQLFTLLDATPAGKHVTLSLDLARGLGYYTGAIFEIAVADLAGSLGGGGRYDELVGMFGKKQLPAVGFSLGLERILVVMEERGMFPALSAGPDLLLCWMGVELPAVLGVAHKLRAQGLKIEVFPEAAKLGKQLQYADSPGVKAPGVAIVGEEELKAGEVTLKHLKSGEQQRVKVDAVAAAVGGWPRA